MALLSKTLLAFLVYDSDLRGVAIQSLFLITGTLEQFPINFWCHLWLNNLVGVASPVTGCAAKAKQSQIGPKQLLLKQSDKKGYQYEGNDVARLVVASEFKDSWFEFLESLFKLTIYNSYQW